MLLAFIYGTVINEIEVGLLILQSTQFFEYILVLKVLHLQHCLVVFLARARPRWTKMRSDPLPNDSLTVRRLSPAFRKGTK